MRVTIPTFIFFHIQPNAIGVFGCVPDSPRGGLPPGLEVALNESLQAPPSAYLAVELADLSALFRVSEVACELAHWEEIMVSVAGEHRNGKMETYEMCL